MFPTVNRMPSKSSFIAVLMSKTCKSRLCRWFILKSSPAPADLPPYDHVNSVPTSSWVFELVRDKLSYVYGGIYDNSSSSLATEIFWWNPIPSQQCRLCFYLWRSLKRTPNELASFMPQSRIKMRTYVRNEVVNGCTSLAWAILSRP